MKAYIALGGNLGDIAACLEEARREIDVLPESRVTASSLIYRTPPLGPPGQPDYLNAVIELETALPPEQLLAFLQKIETRHGRRRGERWGARTLDLDILAVDALILDSDELQLPHPEMERRQFVLRPLCDIAPNWQHPRLKRTAAALLNALLAKGEEPLAKGERW